MTKWLSRTVGTVGIASGFCLLAAGTAHADDTGAAKPEQDSKILHGLVDQLFTAGGDRLKNVSVNGTDLGVAAQELSVDAPARGNGGGVERDIPQHHVLTGQLPAFARTLAVPAAPSLPDRLGAPAQLPGLAPLGSSGQLLGLDAGPTAAVAQSADNLPGFTQQTIDNGNVGNPLSTEDLRLLPDAPSAPTSAVDRGALGTTILSDGTGRRAEELPGLPVAKSALDQVAVNGNPLTSGGINASSQPPKADLTVDPEGPSLPAPITQALGNPVSSLGLPVPAAKPATAAPTSEAVPVIKAAPMAKPATPAPTSDALPVIKAAPTVSNLAGQSTHVPGASAVPMLKGLVTTTLTTPDQADPSGTEALPGVDSLPVLGAQGSGLGAQGSGLGAQGSGLGAQGSGLGSQAADRGGPAVRIPTAKSLPVVGRLLDSAPTAAAPATAHTSAAVPATVPAAASAAAPANATAPATVPAATPPATVPASTQTAAPDQPVRTGGAHRAHRVAASSDERPIAGEDADF